MRSRTSSVASLALLVLLVVGGPAVAASNRVWVSGHGVDQAGCGAPTMPCRSLQYAHDNAVAAGGEIDILDPAGYGSITITKAISIVNDGVGTAGVQASSGAAITINAGPNDDVYLRGLNIDGQKQAAANGIVLDAGGSLTVVGCVIRHFSSDGILIEPGGGAGDVNVLVGNTLLADNLLNGLDSESGGSANVYGTVDHLIAVRNGSDGVRVNAVGGTENYTVADSVLNSNGQGITVETGSLVGVSVVVNVDNTHMDSNRNFGLSADGEVGVHLSRSVLDQNHFAGVNNQTSAPGNIFSTGDNRIEGNAVSKVSGPAMSSDTLN